MTTFAICMCKDEADVIEATVSRMLEQVDCVLVSDNGSTDGTREILEGLPVLVIDDPDPAYYQSRKTSALAARAASLGADWVVPFDADERTYSPHGRIADVLSEVPDTVAVATATLYDHVPTALDSAEPDPIKRTGWRRREAAPLRKVACRASLPVTIEQGNHGAHYPSAVIADLLVVRHFPYRSPAQMVRKARNGSAALAATNLPESSGQHWRSYGRLTDEQIGDVFRTWFWSADPAADPDLIFDPAP